MAYPTIFLLFREPQAWGCTAMQAHTVTRACTPYYCACAAQVHSHLLGAAAFTKQVQQYNCCIASYVHSPLKYFANKDALLSIFLLYLASHSRRIWMKMWVINSGKMARGLKIKRRTTLGWWAKDAVHPSLHVEAYFQTSRIEELLRQWLTQSPGCVLFQCSSLYPRLSQHWHFLKISSEFPNPSFLKLLPEFKDI